MSLTTNITIDIKTGTNHPYGLGWCAVVILLFSYTLGNAQNDEAQLSQSNNYIFDGNYLVNENFVEAEKKYRLGVSIKQNNAAGSYNLGNAYYNSELYDEAMLRHIEAVSNSGSKLEKHKAYHNIGNTLMQQKRCKEAVEAYKNALRNNPSDDESRYNLALAQECAKEQGEGDGDGDDEDKEKDKDENEDEKENSDEKKDNEDKNKEEGGEDEDKNNEGDNEDEDGKPKDDKGDQKNNDPNKDKGQQKPQPGKMSPQQVKNLLEAMSNEEKKVQEKMNASKTKGIKIQTEKDW